MKDLAKYLNIDRTTVSKALAGSPGVSPKTIEKVKKAADELGYRKDSFASGLMTGKNAVLAIVLADITRGIYAPLIERFQRTAREADYGIILYYVDRRQDDFLSVLALLREQRVSGVTFISNATGPEHDNYLKLLAESGVAVNTTGRNFIHPKIDWIRFDNQKAGYLMTRYLIERGHRKIAFISIGHSSGTPYERMVGYTAAMEEAGLPPQLLGRQRTPMYGSGTEVKFAYGVLNESWDEMEKPSAIIGANDDCALGALFVLKERGIAVPRDISLAGFDDWHAVLGVPQITSMRMPIAESGEWAARLLLDRIQKESKSARHILLDYELVVRETISRWNS